MTPGIPQTNNIYRYEEDIIRKLKLREMSIVEVKEFADKVSCDCRIPEVRVFDGRGLNVGSGGYENKDGETYLFIDLPRRFRNRIDALHEITHCIVMCRRHRHKNNSHMKLEDHDAVFLKLFLRLLGKYVKLPRGFSKKWFKIEAEEYGLEW